MPLFVHFLADWFRSVIRLFKNLYLSSNHTIFFKFYLERFTSTFGRFLFYRRLISFPFFAVIGLCSDPATLRLYSTTVSVMQRQQDNLRALYICRQYSAPFLYPFFLQSLLLSSFTCTLPVFFLSSVRSIIFEQF